MAPADHGACSGLFVCLQIDIAGHSKLAAAERILHTSKERFHNQIDGIITSYGFLPFKWEGDDGAFLFQATDGREYEEAVLGAFRILESLPSINEELRLTVGLGQTLAVRVSLDSGMAVYDKNPSLMTGDFLNAFLKNERAISLIDAVTITERVWRQISLPLRGRFIELKKSVELGCVIYRSKKPEATESASQAVPSTHFWVDGSMLRIPRTSSTRRLNLEMKEDVRRRLENLRDRTSAESLAEVVRHALSVYDYLLTEHEKGNRISILGADDIVGPQLREVMIIS